MRHRLPEDYMALPPELVSKLANGPGGGAALGGVDGETLGAESVEDLIKRMQEAKMGDA